MLAICDAGAKVKPLRHQFRQIESTERKSDIHSRQNTLSTDVHAEARAALAATFLGQGILLVISRNGELKQTRRDVPVKVDSRA